MKFYSSSGKTGSVGLHQAVFDGLAPDGGLFMPEPLRRLPSAFFQNIGEMSLPEIGFVVLNALFGDEIPSQKIKEIVTEALNFDIPLIGVENNIYALELYHGPTYAFKDVGARIMARVLSHLNRNANETINVLVATSGDSGGAVANGFYKVPGVEVFVLYPKDKISEEQRAQFASLGENIHAVEVNGTFDDCQGIVRQAFGDKELRQRIKITSANSFNPVRLLPQMIYYFYGYSRVLQMPGVKPDEIVFSVPSGNLGNLCSGLFAKRMGLPVKRFVAANNANNVFDEFLRSGQYSPRKSVLTCASAMDVGRPSNFDRICSLYEGSHERISGEIEGYSFSDEEIMAGIKLLSEHEGYIADPHGMTAYLALTQSLREGETGVFLETAHPAKFRKTVEKALEREIIAPLGLETKSPKTSKAAKPSTISIAPTYSAFKNQVPGIKR